MSSPQVLYVENTSSCFAGQPPSLTAGVWLNGTCPSKFIRMTNKTLLCDGADAVVALIHYDAE